MTTESPSQTAIQNSSYLDSSRDRAIQNGLTDTIADRSIAPICLPPSSASPRNTNFSYGELSVQQLGTTSSLVSATMSTVVGSDGSPDPAQEPGDHTILGSEPRTAEVYRAKELEGDEGEKSWKGRPVYLGTASVEMWIKGRYQQELL